VQRSLNSSLDRPECCLRNTLFLSLEILEVVSQHTSTKNMQRPNSSNKIIWFTYHHTDEARRYYFSPSLKIVTRIDPTSRANDFLVFNRQPLHHEMECSAEQQAQPTQSLKPSKVSTEGIPVNLSLQYRTSMVLLILYWKIVRFFTSPFVASWLLICNICLSYTIHSTDNHHQSQFYGAIPNEWEMLQLQYCVRNTTTRYDNAFG
jgi:hypothetical protein